MHHEHVTKMKTRKKHKKKKKPAALRKFGKLIITGETPNSSRQPHVLRVSKKKNT